MRDNARWRLTDLQRLVVVVLIAAASFLTAMAWGMGNLVLLIVAVALLIVAGLGVFLLGLYYSARPLGRGTATVVSAPPPPVGKIIGRCDLRVKVNIRGARVGVVKLRDPSAPTSKWPRVGDVLPVEIDAHTHHLRVLWDMFEPGQAPGQGLSPAFADTFDVEYLPTPPHPPSIDSSSPTPPPAQRGRVFLDDDMALGPGPELGPSPELRPGRELDTAAGPDRLEPSELDLNDLDLGDLGLSDRDLVGLGLTGLELEELGLGDQDTVRTPPESARSEPGTGSSIGPELAIPQPRPSELPEPEPVAAEPPRGPGARADAAAPTQGISIMLIVSSLDQSIAFYRDLLGFTIADNGSGSAVLRYGGGHVVLRQVADMSRVDRQIVQLYVEVADVQASYRTLRAKGVGFVEPPRVTSRGAKLELWAATFHDPDGHGIALTQWRDREDAPR